jgi:hypothetical protein
VNDCSSVSYSAPVTSNGTLTSQLGQILGSTSTVRISVASIREYKDFQHSLRVDGADRVSCRGYAISIRSFSTLCESMEPTGADTLDKQALVRLSALSASRWSRQVLGGRAGGGDLKLSALSASRWSRQAARPEMQVAEKGNFQHSLRVDGADRGLLANLGSLFEHFQHSLRVDGADRLVCEVTRRVRKAFSTLCESMEPTGHRRPAALCITTAFSTLCESMEPTVTTVWSEMAAY